MSKFINEKISTFNKIEDVLSESKNVFEDFDLLKTLVSEFKDDAKLLRENNLISSGAKGVQDANKSTKFELMAKTSLRLARKALVWASKTKNADAIKAYDVVKSDFNASGITALNHANHVFERLQKDLSSLTAYRITKVNLDELELAIAEAQKFSSEPITKILRGVEANKTNKALIKKIDLNLSHIEDLVVSEYEEDNISFVRLFLSARHITNLGSRKTKLLVTVTDKDGKPIMDAFANILEMENEEQYSDESGELTIVGIKNGTYHLEVSKADIKISTQFTIKLGEQLKLKVVI